MKYIKKYEKFGSFYEVKFLDKEFDGRYHWKFMTTKEYLSYNPIKDELSEDDFEKLNEIFSEKMQFDEKRYPFKKLISNFGEGKIKIFGSISKIDPESIMGIWEYSMQISSEYTLGNNFGKSIEDYILFAKIQDIEEFIHGIRNWISIEH